MINKIQAISLFAIVMGTTPSLHAQLSQRKESSLMEAALRCALDQRHAWGLDEQYGFTPLSAMEDQLGKVHTRLQQLYHGLPILGGDLILHGEEENFRSHTATHSLLQNISINPTASLDEKEAIAIAQKDLALKGCLSVPPQTRLVIAPLYKQVVCAEKRHLRASQLTGADMEVVAQGYRLAYEIQFWTENALDGFQGMYYLVDAHDGHILQKFDNLKSDHEKGTGHSQFFGEVELSILSSSQGYTLQDGTRSQGGNATYNMNHANYNSHSKGYLYTSQDNQWGDGENYLGQSSSGKNGQTAAVDAHYGLQVAWDYYKRVHGRNGVDNRGGAVYSRVHAGRNLINAFWGSSGQPCMTFGDGNANSGYKTLTSLDVLAHEMSHGVCAASSGLAYYGESGGLNEANSDIMGTMVEFYGQGGGYASQSDTVPETGGNFTIAEQVTSRPFRYMDKPSKDGRSPDAWYQGLGNIDVHYSSGPGNRMFYFLCKGATSSGDTASKYLSKGMKGVGNHKAAQIWYRALTVYFTSYTNYAKAREGCITAAQDLYGKASAEEAAVHNAFAAINVGKPWPGASPEPKPPTPKPPTPKPPTPKPPTPKPPAPQPPTPKTPTPQPPIPKQPAPSEGTVPASLTKGKKGADIVGVDANGKTVKLSDHLGKVIILDISATWCGPCNAEAPGFNAFYEKHKAKGLVCVTCLGDGASQQAVAAWVSKHKLTMPTMNDAKGKSGPAGEFYVKATKGYPSFIVFDQKMIVQAFGAGDVEVAEKVALNLLKEAPPAPSPTPTPTPTPAPQEKPIELGQKAPEILGITGDGKAIKLSDYAGKPILINLVANWCKPCLNQAQPFNAFHETYQSKDLICITAMADGAKQKDAAAWQQQYGLTMPVIADTKGRKGAIEKRFLAATGYYPTFILIDKDHIVRYIIPCSLKMAQEETLKLLGVEPKPQPPAPQPPPPKPPTPTPPQPPTPQPPTPKPPAPKSPAPKPEEDTVPLSLTKGKKGADIVGVDANGKTLKLSDHLGKVIILDISATWCGPCNQEAPSFNAFYEKHKDKGLVCLTCLGDGASQQAVAAWVNKHKLTMPVMNDAHGKTGPSAQFYVKVTQGYPSFIVFDRKMIVQAFGAGNMAAAENAALALLKQATPDPQPPAPKPPTPKPQPPTPKPPPPAPKPPTPKPPPPKPQPPAPKPPAPEGPVGHLGEPDMQRMKTAHAFLCSDECAGRLTGSAGERVAGDYIAKVFQEAGLQPIKSNGFGGSTLYHMPWRYSAGYHVPSPNTPVANAWWLSEEVSRAGDAFNIACMLPGSDPQLKSEYIVVTAHYDHLGQTSSGVIYRGADDNASGTVGLLEVAQCLKQAKPKRSVIFLACSGEEKGLLGSQAFLRNCPVPVSAIKGNINMDMIGRNGAKEVHITPAKLDGQVNTIARDARNIAKAHQLPLSAGIDAYYRQSDHYSFAARSIPCVFFNTAAHQDLHRPSDTLEKINHNKMHTIIKIVRDLVVKVASDTQKPSYLQKSEWSQWQWGSYGVRTDQQNRPVPLMGPPAE